MTRRVSQYAPATDDEKAAAMDAAIDYEDRYRPRKGRIMDEKNEPLTPEDELIELTLRMKRDKTRLMELCLLVLGGPETPPAKDTRRPKANSGGEAKGSESGVVRKEYWRKVRCAMCGTITGAIRKGPGAGVLYPGRHKNAEGTARCPGMDKAAAIVTEA